MLSRNPGRTAGLWYLLLILIGPLRLIYIPSKLIVDDNAAATAANIATHERLFRMGIVSDLLGGVVLILLAMALYRLFKGVDKRLGAMVVIFGGVLPSTLYFVNVVNDAAALMIARGADFLAAFDKPQRDALVMLFVRMHDHQVSAAELLWGVWLFPLAVLAYRSRFLPRFIGVWLFINGVAYVVLSFAGFFLPEYQDKLFFILQPAMFGEIVFMLWLVIKGSSPQAPDATVPAPARP